jgi:hypothetical protein
VAPVRRERTAEQVVVLDQSFVCVDCGKVSPATDEGETITRQHGWRISRLVVDGAVTFEPRCPECFARSRPTVAPQTPVLSGEDRSHLGAVRQALIDSGTDGLTLAELGAKTKLSAPELERMLRICLERGYATLAGKRYQARS